MLAYLKSWFASVKTNAGKDLLTAVNDVTSDVESVKTAIPQIQADVATALQTIQQLTAQINQIKAAFAPRVTVTAAAGAKP
jgi:peptidoglycan hydrolase CwlO-like protein